MTDLLHVLPDFDSAQYSHILPSIEKAFITINDLLVLDPFDVAKRASVPSAETRRLKEHLLLQLQLELEQDEPLPPPQGPAISSLDASLDSVLNGGFPAGHLTEVTGERQAGWHLKRASGKTQLLLSLCLAVQLPPPHGLSRSALYITTEGPLQTTRLSQILRSNPTIDLYDSSLRPTLAGIHSIKVSDLESQEHILQYQVPVAITRHNVGLVVIDSIAANFRAEFDPGMPSDTLDSNKQKTKRLAFNERNKQLVSLGNHLRTLARQHNMAIVVANQVLDRFTPPSQHLDHASQSSRASSQQRLPPPRSSPAPVPPPAPTTCTASAPLPTADPLTPDHQLRFTTGWGDALPSVLRSADSAAQHHAANAKTPSLGQVWTAQLSARVVLRRSPVYRDHDWRLGVRERDVARWRRGCRVVFAPWVGEDRGGVGVEVEIWEGGMRGVVAAARDGEGEDYAIIGQDARHGNV